MEKQPVNFSLTADVDEHLACHPLATLQLYSQRHPSLPLGEYLHTHLPRADYEFLNAFFPNYRQVNVVSSGS